MSQKIRTITLQVPQKSSGGIIHQRETVFDVFKDEGHYSLRPCISDDDRRILNLPEELNFVIKDGKPVSLRGSLDGNFHVIQDAFKQLQEHQQLA